MRRFLIGIDGSNTPDPEYWRARNEFITAETPEEAKDIWCYMRGEWLRADEVPFVRVIEVDINGKYDRAYMYDLTEKGIRKVEGK